MPLKAPWIHNTGLSDCLSNYLSLSRVAAVLIDIWSVQFDLVDTQDTIVGEYEIAQ